MRTQNKKKYIDAMRRDKKKFAIANLPEVQEREGAQMFETKILD
jgi:hypothetical protein